MLIWYPPTQVIFRIVFFFFSVTTFQLYPWFWYLALLQPWLRCIDWCHTASHHCSAWKSSKLLLPPYTSLKLLKKWVNLYICLIVSGKLHNVLTLLGKWGVILLLYALNVKWKWVNSNFQIIDLLVPPLTAGVTGMIVFVHIAILLHYKLGCMWDLLLVYLIHYMRTRNSYFYVPLRDTELCD